ncbi:MULTISPECIES: guanitoxin biosynthesis heme-dependent pre-guanitoxin N-hydroxylase GntA [unclassified Arsukibacterium]|uniref:guanitoxin biosynthesis heme-dependent pre-guanitoxin N-hydroxylase GntA n=1 Tax=unclassified Arsukibacterium TaxID=2635278 RepID=UPI0025C70E4A|nr:MULTISPECIES: guanitoxin biosynthesis heme-dependent pre-guanitoxin N-hydroxylase GntA [unclassified Arsukibacterium]|tara:strand:- start:8884 stop:9594 length:711 start_codon:yes stop_codon:yes gene_type:complete
MQHAVIKPTNKLMNQDDGSEWLACFDEFITQHGYPCVGAKIARNKRRIELHKFRDISSEKDDEAILHCIYQFISQFKQQNDIFFSLVCVFPGSDTGSDAGFERALWARLQALHNKDSKRFNWDSRVSDIPAETHFSFSLGGEAFFIIGLNPYSQRKSRQFRYPAIVFNLHNQFEQLKEQNKFYSMRQQIRKNDAVFCGKPNPVLADHGEVSEARQYSGRAVGAEWRCPFSARRHNE